MFKKNFIYEKKPNTTYIHISKNEKQTYYSYVHAQTHSDLSYIQIHLDFKQKNKYFLSGNNFES